MTNLIHRQILELSAYQTVPFSGPVKLDAMESPYGISSTLQSEWQAVLGQVDVNRYPDPGAVELKERLSQVFSIPTGYRLTLGNGSDELLQLIQLTVGGHGRTIMAPQPSFSMYEIIAQYTRAKFVGVDLNDSFQLSKDKWLDSVQTHTPSCVFFAYPNNPTGNFFDPELIEQTAQMIEGIVVADEAYFAYSGRSLLPLLEQHDNIVVVRTLSKSGLAGLRLGYMISHPRWAENFEKLRMPYNVGVLNQAGAVFALDHWGEVCRTIQFVLDERQRVREELECLTGLEIYDSETNFIVLKTLNKSADEVFDDMKQRGILIRKLNSMHPMLDNFLRISVGLPHENDAMINALRESLEGV